MEKNYLEKKWPPIGWLWENYRECAAWFSGNKDLLVRDTEGFWKSREQHKVHVPIAADIASLSAGLMFGESPSIQAGDSRTNARLQTLLDQTGLYGKLLTAAESQSALGGVFLKIVWDNKLGFPQVSVVPADCGLPVYNNGELHQCAFWNVVATEEDVIWRLMEIYTDDGMIISCLFKGSHDRLGKQVLLDALEQTKDIPSVAQSNVNQLLAIYVPNRLPSRAHPNEPYGRSDFEGLTTLFSALDEAYSSMMRDVRLGKTRIIVPMEFLRRKEMVIGDIGNTRKVSWEFDVGEEIFTALDINPQDSGADITTIQPQIRAEEHIKVISDIIERIIINAGYSPQSIGLGIKGRIESGTALSILERRSQQTTSVKQTYWYHGLHQLVKALLQVDNSLFRQDNNIDSPVSITFADNSQTDVASVASTLETLSKAGAVSTITKIRTLHPDWALEDVEQEANRILYKEQKKQEANRILYKEQKKQEST